MKGGLIVNIGVEAFLPSSQVDVVQPKNLDALVGEPTLPPCTESILRTEGSEFWRFDGRLHLEQNTLDSPAAGAESELTYKSGCPNVAKTFLTRGKCKLQETCAPLVFGSQLLQLDAATLRAHPRRRSRPHGSRSPLRPGHYPCPKGYNSWLYLLWYSLMIPFAFSSQRFLCMMCPPSLRMLSGMLCG